MPFLAWEDRWATFERERNAIVCSLLGYYNYSFVRYTSINIGIMKLYSDVDVNTWVSLSHA